MKSKREIKNSDVRSRVNKETKEKAEAVLKEMGLNLSTAIRMYLEHLIKEAKKK